ncbi:hypothetical protein [Kitasatospora sp. NPDC005748]|uniref:hypothetical protein n=1 Tax=Kitasatospora sp. NPDC005748 TaxID=3157063 RepID=UPI00340B852B
MSNHLDHASTARAWLASIHNPDSLTATTKIEAAKVEAYLALAAAIAELKGTQAQPGAPVR